VRFDTNIGCVIVLKTAWGVGMKLILAVYIFALLGVQSAAAQKTLAEIQSAVSVAASELEAVDALLNDPDQNKRLAAMQMLVQSGNPTYIKRAKEVGLFSSDAEMRRAAIGAVLDQGGPFRLELDLSQAGDAAKDVRWWIYNHRGSVDDSLMVGQVTFSPMPYSADTKCWASSDKRQCFLIPTGAAYSLDGWHDGSGSLKLMPDGALLGTFSVNISGRSNKSVPARIPLAE
jgi:hypothetical protein